MSRTAVAFAEPRRAGGVPGPDAPASSRPVPALRVVPATLAEDPLPFMLDAVYDAGLAPERWPDALAVLAAGLGGSAATLHAGPAAGPFRITAAFGLGEAALRAYRDRFGALDPIARAAARGSAWTAPATAREAAGAGLERTEFFAGWMRPHGFDDALCLELLPPGGAAAAHRASLRIARPPGAPRFGPVEVASLSRLAPHLRRAVEMHRRLSATVSVPAGPLAEALDRLVAGVALLDAGGALVWANRTAELLLQAGDGLFLDRNGLLRATAPGTADRLRRLVGVAAAGAEGAMPVPRPSGCAALALHAVPLPHGADHPAAAEREAAPLPLAASAPRPSVLLVLCDPAGRGTPDPALQRRLQAIYGLTAAEAMVAARTAHGVGLPEVAQSLGLAVATARTHAQRVFSKAGVRGQAELARQVERLSLVCAPSSSPAAGGRGNTKGPDR